MKPGLKIIFMGTPEFAVASLAMLVRNGYNVTAVVTAPDRPAGRGLGLQQSPVKQYAVEKGLNVLQPEKLKDEKFIEKLQALGADLQVVVAFRMLPEIVWKMPRLGTFNLHASLLPQYRGAAPINRAIMNGEKETGVTTFFLRHEIDTGKIIFREKVPIGNDETAGELHDKLMHAGAELVLNTVKAIESGDYPQTDQSVLAGTGLLKEAPKIFKDGCKVNWNDSAQNVHNFIRGLSPHPAAFTNLVSTDGTRFSVKLFRTAIEATPNFFPPGQVITDGSSFLKIVCSKGVLHILDLQLSGKKRMLVSEFLKGFRIGAGWKAA